MSASSDTNQQVVPAQLGFLAIYNPSLGNTDETLDQQIVYYSPRTSGAKGRGKADVKTKEAAAREESNEQLRQIGLAQGMVEFGKSFSDGKSVSTIETEKSRIVLHELESGWWIIAASLHKAPTEIADPKLPTTATPGGKGTDGNKPTTEYSSREVKPAILLLGDLLRAHATFLLHHASSLSALFVRTRRSKFIGILTRYWDTYIATWNVLMHGNPAASLYSGIKIAACGELGIGVGEEERGSGEREVLEGFVGRIENLVDVIVSKFGDVETQGLTEPPKPITGQARKTIGPWLGTGDEIAAEDGAIFLGTGALSRKSIRDVTHWMEDLYRWGPYAYGVVDNPSSTRRTKATKRKGTDATHAEARDLSPEAKKGARQDYGLLDQNKQSRPNSPQARPSLDTGIHSSESTVTLKLSTRRTSFKKGSSIISHNSTDSESAKTSKFVQYLKMGYGTHWTLGSTSSKGDRKISAEPALTSSPPQVPTSPISQSEHTMVVSTGGDMFPQDDSIGHYLVGLMGNIEEYEQDDDEINDEDDTHNDRILLRTLTLELVRAEDARSEADLSIDLGKADLEQETSNHGSEHTATSNLSHDSGQDRNKARKLRAVVYVNKPFMFVFLFDLRTDALAWPTLYRSLHRQMVPLLKPLLRSTKFRATKPQLNPVEAADVGTPIYDLVWDPRSLTLNSTVPNIPDPYQQFSRSLEPLPWSRIEAMNTHMQIINMYIATTTEGDELERTCKTSRGWWVVWTLIPEMEPASSSLTSGIVKVPTFIPEDSTETNIISASLVGPPKSKSKSARSASRGTSGSKSRHSSLKSRSMTSSVAHPFLEVTTPVNGNECIPRDKEIFLIRRASDHIAAKSSSTMRFSSPAAADASAPGRLVQGIGVDTKRYIEALLNITR
ncbi:hypothetical protein BP6252_12442 [Coleophoma cylindrospora]|uniref:CCZ1/INTU/HSP4 first Longin domain-containing protein n=1 Tax=Coleophoma cylindrospora TaxID=1849047 RepID=A0A3D8QGZ9_9HELO|nr:hypothetical protein BP6252_12442 [Coleophoma cylindrospora]